MIIFSEGGEEDQESLDFFASFSEDPDLVGAATVRKVDQRASGKTQVQTIHIHCTITLSL